MNVSWRSRAGLNFGTPWVLMCVAFGLHTWDEAAHDFLTCFNSTVLALCGHFSWFPRMDMEFRTYLLILVLPNLVLLLLTPWAYQNAKWLRPLAYAFAGIQLLNGTGHILLTIRGHSVPSVHFDGPAPGAYTAPLLLILAAYLIWSCGRAEDNRRIRPLRGMRWSPLEPSGPRTGNGPVPGRKRQRGGAVRWCPRQGAYRNA